MAAKVTKTQPLSPTGGRFEADRHSLEIGFATVLVLLALTMLFSAIWMGLAFANGLVRPIRGLIERPTKWLPETSCSVPTRRSDGDLGHLGDTFNKMTSELLRQQTGLIDANALDDERRALALAVLSGVPAGVLQGLITTGSSRFRTPPQRLLGGDIGIGDSR